MATTQGSLFDLLKDKGAKKRYSRTTHGGTKKYRKVERPLSTRRWIHLVLKSHKAKGSLSLLSPKNRFIVEEIVRTKAKKFHITIADMVNMGDHIHLKIKISNRKGFQSFLRAVTTLIARKVTGARRGHKFGRFWQGLAFTRILRSAFEVLGLKGYFEANRVEAVNGYPARRNYLKSFNQWLYRKRAAGP